MISFRAWTRAIGLVFTVNTMMVIMIFVIALSSLSRYKKHDIKPEKLDTVKPWTTTEKGEVMTNRYRWPCTLVKVIDGDTLEAEIHLDFGVKLQAKFRLAGIDTPEIHTAKHNTEEYRKGILAKKYVEAQMGPPGSKFWIETDGKRPGKYGRFIVIVLLQSGEYLDKLLVKSGHAVEKEY